MIDHCQGETHDTTSATSVSLSWFFVLLDIDPGIDNSRLPVDGGEMQQEDIGSKLRVGEQQICLAGREFLPSVHRQAVYALEETTLPSETELPTYSPSASKLSGK